MERLQLEKLSCKYGAPMGRVSTLPDKGSSVKLQMSKLKFVDECYDSGGAYWGMPANVYHAECQEPFTRMFIRASSRKEAKEIVREQLPNAKFYR